MDYVALKILFLYKGIVLVGFGSPKTQTSEFPSPGRFQPERCGTRKKTIQRLQNRPLPVVSRVKTPLIGVKTPVAHLEGHLYRGSNSIYNDCRGPSCTF